MITYNLIIKKCTRANYKYKKEEKRGKQKLIN